MAVAEHSVVKASCLLVVCGFYFTYKSSLCQPYASFKSCLTGVLQEDVWLKH